MRPIRVESRLDPEFRAISDKFTQAAREALRDAVALGFDSMQTAYMLQSDIWCEEFLVRESV